MSTWQMLVHVAMTKQMMDQAKSMIVSDCQQINDYQF